jgi:hypothetical protein
MSKVLDPSYSENRWDSTDKIFTASVGLFVVSAVALVIIFSIANHLGLNKETVLYTTCALGGFAVIAMITSVAVKLCHQPSSIEQSSVASVTNPSEVEELVKELKTFVQEEAKKEVNRVIAPVTDSFETQQLTAAIQEKIKEVEFTQEILNQFRKNGSEFDENDRTSLEEILNNEIFMPCGSVSHFSTFLGRPSYALILAGESSPPLARLIGSLLLQALSKVRATHE